MHSKQTRAAAASCNEVKSETVKWTKEAASVGGLFRYGVKRETEARRPWSLPASAGGRARPAVACSSSGAIGGAVS